jgi:Methylase involved in ubiquinone/menaquinone biosynthesis
MAFKQYVRAEIAAGLDETYQFETWAEQTPGRAYYDVHVSVIDQRETCVPTLRRVLAGSGKRILESGCGTGRWMAFFERLGHRAFGVDDSAGPLRVARAHDADLRLVRGDALVTPFKNASFDVVFSSYVAEHFEDGPAAVLREMHRLLKPGGLLLLIVPYNSALRRLLTNRILQLYYLMRRLQGRGLAFTEFRFSFREIVALVEGNGFRVEHVEPDDFRLPWGKGLSLDFGPLVLTRPDTWELNAVGRLAKRALGALSPWSCAAGILLVARAV